MLKLVPSGPPPSPDDFLHIPLFKARIRMGGEPGAHTWSIGCSCGFWWPYEPSITDEQLMSQHPTLEPPSGCFRCQIVARNGEATKASAPWRRYFTERIDGQWVYVCNDDYTCKQRQLAAAAVHPRYNDPDYTALIAPENAVGVSIDDSFHKLQGRTLDDAIALRALAGLPVPPRT